jgi:hypothetical protein
MSLPPLMLQVLPGVTRVPIFPKGGAGFDGLPGILFSMLFIVVIFL